MLCSASLEKLVKIVAIVNSPRPKTGAFSRPTTNLHKLVTLFFHLSTALFQTLLDWLGWGD